jgi:transposase
VGQRVARVIIAVDPHKRVHAVVVLDEAGRVLARQSFANTGSGYRELLSFARRWRHREWAIEGAGVTGKHLAQRLVAQGETVIDVPSRRSSLVRAYASNSGLCWPVGRRGTCPPTQARTLLATVRPRDEVGKLRKQLVAEQLADLAGIDERLRDINCQSAAAVAATPATLTEIYGVAAVVTAIFCGEVRDIARFRNRHDFASYNGSAPGPWGSGGDARPCVNLRGNHRLNHALHIIAVSQMRSDTDGRRLLPTQDRRRQPTRKSTHR